MDIKEKILYISFLLFIENGFSDVSLNEIILKLNIAKGSFYHYFKSKDELIECAIKRYIYPFFDIHIAFQKQRCFEEKGSDSYEKMRYFFSETPDIDELLNVFDGKVSFRDFYFLAIQGMKKFEYLAEHRRKFFEFKVYYLKELLKEAKNEGAISETIDVNEWATAIQTLKEGVFSLNLLDESINIRTKCHTTFDRIWDEIKK